MKNFLTTPLLSSVGACLTKPPCPHWIIELVTSKWSVQYRIFGLIFVDTRLPTTVKKSITPTRNSFAFFKVTPQSFHQVRLIETQEIAEDSFGIWLLLFRPCHGILVSVCEQNVFRVVIVSHQVVMSGNCWRYCLHNALRLPSHGKKCCTNF